MKSRPYILSETNWKSVKETAFELAILPWGATEAHNYHLPYSTDTVQSTGIAEMAAAKSWEKGAKVIVLPAIPYGVNVTQLSLNMVISMLPGTQLAILKNIVHSLEHHGIKKLIILNGHGGNEFKAIIRELKCLHPDFFVGCINWWQIPIDKKYFSEPGEHAGELETANMLCFTPEWVLPKEEWGNGKSGNFAIPGFRDGWAWAPREWDKISNDTGIGNPANATAENAKAYLEELTDMIAEAFIGLSKAAPQDFYKMFD